MLRGSTALIVAIAVGLLPERPRARFDGLRLPLSAGAVFGGALEVLLAPFLLLATWPPYFQRVAGAAHDELGQMAVTSDVMPGNGVFMMLGFTAFLGYLFASPAGLLVLTLFVEGILRAAAGAAGMPVGTALLGVPWLLAARARRIWLARRPPRPLPDLVTAERDGHGLLIDAAAPRAWQKDTTIRVEGGVFRLVGYRHDLERERPHQYRFERVPAWWQGEAVPYDPAAGEG